MQQQLIFTNNPGEALDKIVSQSGAKSVFVIADTNTSVAVLPRLIELSRSAASAKVIICEAGDANKNLESLSVIWSDLNASGATRASMIINVGGGMVTDMGGFAAATFKRGMHFVNVPTTLLAAVDASVGGKTGINFSGCKNEIGVFAEADASVISTVFFGTLSHRELLSGYAEMIKHALLDSRKAFGEILLYDFDAKSLADGGLLRLLETSVGVKRRIVDADMHETGLRKALNLGHTAGHAFESFAMRKGNPVPHGYAVAWGLVVELVLSNMLMDFPSDLLMQYVSFVRDNYGAFYIDCDNYAELLGFMRHDKKNASPDCINFSLLHDAGDIRIDCTVPEESIKVALDIYRDLMGI